MFHYTPEELSHCDHLDRLQQQHISVHGFINRTPTNDLILASQPDVPSCCLGAQSKRSQQLYLEGDVGVYTAHQIAYLEGDFYLLQEAEQPHKMLLKNTKPWTPESSSGGLAYGLIIGSVLCALVYISLTTLWGGVGRNAALTLWKRSGSAET